MKRAVLAAVLAIFAISVPTALGAKGTSASISVSQKTVAFGYPTTVSGVAAGSKASGALVTLQAKPFGSNSFTSVQSETATASGSYSFTYYPLRNTTVRVVAKTAPTATSHSLFVGVLPFVGLRVGTVRPSKGQLVRFMGIVNPAFNGKTVLIQRRTVNGGWNTVASATLFGATPGSHGPRSQYFRRVRVNRSGTYRAFFPAAPGWLSNHSRTRTLIVH
jgi:hypothetical protein